MQVTFDELCEKLATSGGGFALWFGAGASIASTNRSAPDWDTLVENIIRDNNESYVAEHGALPIEASCLRRAPELRSKNMPVRLEYIASAIGHETFRKQLRKQLVDTIVPSSLNYDVIADQAIIGTRSAALVSFNIEDITALPFSFGRGGGAIARTFYERRAPGVIPEMEVKPGPTASPVYFPHGLINQVNLVMTKSEYDRHRGSLAVATAVHLAVGSDLVIMGMSLGDTYLRAAILKNRRWLRNVYWLGSECRYREWARVADVTFVVAQHSKVWSGLAEAFMDHDKEGILKKRRQEVMESLPDLMAHGCTRDRSVGRTLEEQAQIMASTSRYSVEQITDRARLMVDMGFGVPDVLRRDPRCRLGLPPTIRYLV